MFAYDLTSELCAAPAALFADSSGAASSVLGDLRLAAGASCLRHNGVASSASADALQQRLYTTKTATTAFLSRLDSSTGLTLELWLRHQPLTTAADAPLLTIGQGSAAFLPGGSSASSFACPSAADLVVFRRGNKYGVTVNYGTSDCTTVLSNDDLILDDTGPTHVALTFDWTSRNGNMAIALHLNGGSGSSSSGGSTHTLSPVAYPSTRLGTYTFAPNFAGKWSGSSQLQLMSSYATAAAVAAADAEAAAAAAQPWIGELYMAAAYDRALGSTAVATNFAALLTNSAPSVKSSIVVVQEDGMASDHYGTPEYYRQAAPVADLATLTITAYDFESDAANEFVYSGTNPPPTLHLSSLPDKGTLYDSADAVITSTAQPLPQGSGGTALLRYRPLLDESSGAGSIYTAFNFYAVDGATGQRSVTDATISISVVPADDPPVADMAAFQALTGAENTLCVTGSDVDSGDAVVGVVLMAAPTHGTLFKMEQGSATLTPLSVGHSWGTGGQLCAAYVYTGTESSTEAGQVLLEDSFYFAVLDGKGHQSTSAKATVTVKQGKYSWSLPMPVTVCACVRRSHRQQRCLQRAREDHVELP